MSSAAEAVRAGMKAIASPGGYDKVYKDECVFSYDDAFTPSGLYVNMKTWHGVGERFLNTDYARAGCGDGATCLYFQQKFVKKPVEKEETKDPEKLAIGVEGGFADKDHTIEKEFFLAVFNGSEVTHRVKYPFADADDMPMIVTQCCEAIEKHAGASVQQESNVWEDNQELKESKYAKDLKQVDRNTKVVSGNPKDWKCELHGNTDNLWLNLSDGFIGGGRKNWDGSGGSGGALEHYEAEKAKGNEFPLVVKLGTITPHGADVYSYAPDENDQVLDSKLADHLAHWGIDIMKLEKTEKTTRELEVELNAQYDWGKVCESGSKLEPLTGAGHVGFVNLGNTCYMNSCLQVLLSMEEVVERYNSKDVLLSKNPSDQPRDAIAQFAKLAVAANTENELALSRPPKTEHSFDASNIVAMRMLRNAIIETTSDFRTNRQQDAPEFLSYFLAQLAKGERPAFGDRFEKKYGLTQGLFEFEKEERYEDTANKEVAYVAEQGGLLSV